MKTGTYAYKHLALSLLLGTAVSAAMADDWYVGVGGGVSSVDKQDLKYVMSLDAATTIGIHNTDIGFKAYGGYRLNREYAFELGYTDLGQTDIQGTWGANTAAITATAKGYSLSGIGAIPVVGNLSLFGRIGVVHWDAEMTCTGTACGTFTTVKNDETDPLIGFGASYSFTPNLAVRMEWEQSRQPRRHDTVGLEFLSAGLLYRF